MSHTLCRLSFCFPHSIHCPHIPTHGLTDLFSLAWYTNDPSYLGANVPYGSPPPPWGITVMFESTSCDH